MVWGDVQTWVENNLGKVGDLSVIALLPIWADAFQKKVQRDRNYWFLKSVAERTVDATAQTYPLPANFRDDMIFYLKTLVSGGFSSNSFIELDAITDIDIIRTYDPVDVAGVNPALQKAQPEAYVIGSNAMTLWPWPDRSYVLRCQYWKDVDPPLSSSPSAFTNKWISDYPELYVQELTAMGFRYLQEHGDAKEWEALAKVTLNDVRAANVARQLEGKVTLVPIRGQFGTTRDSSNLVWKVYG